MLVREPVGVVAAVVPWNGAPGLITSKVAPALLAGCTIILKASPEAPGSAYILAKPTRTPAFPWGIEYPDRRPGSFRTSGAPS